MDALAWNKTVLVDAALHTVKADWAVADPPGPPGPEDPPSMLPSNLVKVENTTTYNADAVPLTLFLEAKCTNGNVVSGGCSISCAGTVRLEQAYRQVALTENLVVPGAPGTGAVSCKWGRFANFNGNVYACTLTATAFCAA